MDRLLILRFVLAMLLCFCSTGAMGEDFAAIRGQVESLGKLTTAPVFRNADGFDESDPLRAVYFDAMPYQGKPTRVYAWLGIPPRDKLQNPNGKFPGIVLVHGGGGSAFKEWVQKWNERGFAAISIAVEGQTDNRDATTKEWQRHPWAGPRRDGIYGDSDKPLTDQWMYHAVADTILANSLLRSLPSVDAGNVGVMGISWGGVITSTVIGIDQRFAFAIPTYGCGNLASADNQYGRALGSNELYKQVWDPMLRLDKAAMPTLWLSWPGDQHFPLDLQSACYRAMPGKTMVSLIPRMNHSHPAGWNPPDSYAFAESVVREGQPWCRQTGMKLDENLAAVTFVSSKPLDDAVLVSTTDNGITGNRTWTESPAKLVHQGEVWRVSTTLPPGTTAWFVNVHSKGLTASSEYMSVVTKDRATIGSRASEVPFPRFGWDRVPLNLHFGKRTTDLTDLEIEFLARHSDLICLEKGHGSRTHGSTEGGIADTARRIVALNADAKVLFYFNAFINWPGYEAFESYRDVWTLRNASGDVIKHPSGTPRPDPSNAEFREWWSEVVARANRSALLSGVFVDAIPQALSPALARQVGDAKARAIVDGLRQMIALTKRKLGPDSIVLVNGLRTKDFREILDWEGIDGVMIEHFGAFNTDSPEDMKSDLESISLAAGKGKFVVLKAWPGFTWLDRDMMQRPHAELLTLARERITFPLACFLIGAQQGSHFCYSWGYTDTDGMLDSYPEFDRQLGPPKGNATWQGFTATREFEHASVRVDLSTREASIDWRSR